MTYKRRVVDSELTERLSSAGAVVIEGPKACGKTETARQLARSEVLFDIDERARQAAALTPERVLKGETPRLIDEWQHVPEIWNHIRREVDHRRAPGQFILTGSSLPAEDALRHSGAGRVSRLLMRPMSLFETEHATGEVSMTELLDGRIQGADDPGIEIVDIADLLAVGGWPGHLSMNVKGAVRSTRDYVNEIIRTDIVSVDGVRRDPQKLNRLMASLARNVATEASNNTLAADTGGADGSLHRDTVRDYLTALERLMVVEDQPAWSPHLRSRTRMRQAAKRHFVDPSLAVAALHGRPERLLDDLNFMGLLFESLVIRDLRVYTQALDAEVLHYRDETGLEVDAIVQVGDGRWAALEIKLGSGPSVVDAAAKNLLAFAGKVDTDRCGSPAVLAVITGSGYGFQRDDGIGVIPVGALGP